MHMADMLISPVVGGAMYATTIGVAAYSIRKIKNEMDDQKIPLMGAIGAFVFAAQMINFTIPGTGSSGHLGGGMLLAILLGPNAGFLTMAAILLIQALFFGDGGLLAYGCNVFNLGFYTCFIAYPIIYKLLTRKGLNTKRIFTASIIASIIGLQLGSLSVVLETFLSGKTEVPFVSFLSFMQLIHLAIGVVEGLVTGAIVSFVWKAKPELLESASQAKDRSAKKIVIIFIVAFIAVGGALSWFASSYPDGLEWSIEKTTGTTELEQPEGIHKTLSGLQEKTAILPDYGFKDGGEEDNNAESQSWPAVNSGTSVSGLVGGALTLAIVVITGLIISTVKKKRKLSKMDS